MIVIGVDVHKQSVTAVGSTRPAGCLTSADLAVHPLSRLRPRQLRLPQCRPGNRERVDPTKTVVSGSEREASTPAGLVRRLFQRWRKRRLEYAHIQGSSEGERCRVELSPPLAIACDQP